MIRVGIVGVGRQGSKYVAYFFQKPFENSSLCALCDIDSTRFEETDPLGACAHYNDYEQMFDAGVIDAVIIDTPHYLHPTIALAAVKRGIHVLSDKPLGVDALAIKKIQPHLLNSKLSFGVLFNQRAMPIFQKIKEVISQKQLGTLKRCVWQITDWYRPQKYYDIGEWRSTWRGEGGGVLINQCVHNIDMICYLFGRPKKILSSVGYGVYHRTEVDDSVIANLYYDEGFCCTLISSTGETPGTNRLEISGTLGKMVFDEVGKLKFTKNEIPEDIFSITAESPRYSLKFGKPNTTYRVEECLAKVDSHWLTIDNFLRSVENGTQPCADYFDGLTCAETINAIYYSDWIGSCVNLPVNEEDFFELLKEKW